MENFKEESLNVQHSKFDYEKEDAYLRAKKKLDKLIAFYWHLAVYVIINVFLIVLIGTQSGDGFWHFGTYATALFWGIGLLFHFFAVYGPGLMFGKKWEANKIKEYMDKDRQEYQRFK